VPAAQSARYLSRKGRKGAKHAKEEEGGEKDYCLRDYSDQDESRNTTIIPDIITPSSPFAFLAPLRSWREESGVIRAAGTGECLIIYLLLV
jgi:hypothetical protein